ncbi:ACP S-malonyltransferase [Acidobacteriota bacterium]
MDSKIGFLFPAFGAGYDRGEKELFPGYREELARLLPRASEVVEIDRESFESPANDLQAHYVCYINSCVVSNALKSLNIVSDYVAPYSMGLFAALYHVSSYSFEDGLLLTHNICRFALEAVDGGVYGMGVIIGLPYEQVVELIAKNCTRVELADLSNEHVAIASGWKPELEKLMQIAAEKGSLHTGIMPVSLPYHSSFLKATEGRIREFLNGLDIKSPAHKIISCTDQKVLTTVDEVRREVTVNVSHNINWFLTMKKMLELGVNLFVECGASESLTKQAKFFKGDFKVYHPRRFKKLFACIQ